LIKYIAVFQGLVDNSEWWFQQSRKLGSCTTANCIRELLTKVLDKRYPNLDDITIPELLEWAMWPSFLGMINNIEVKEDQHNIAIITALSVLQNLSDTISKKSIILESLDYVKNKRHQLKKLCDAVNSGKKQICNCLQYLELEEHLNECFRLQTLYLDYRNRISTLLEFCSSISDGMFNLISYIKSKYKRKEYIRNDYIN